MAVETASLAFGAPARPLPPGRRGEARQDVVRIVEYTPFPRSAANQRQRVGFTRDVSDSGLCIGVDHAEPAGGLLRIVLRDLDGSALCDGIARVIWCTRERDGRHWHGLDHLTETPAPGRDR